MFFKVLKMQLYTNFCKTSLPTNYTPIIVSYVNDKDPLPQNEFKRLLSLAELDLDYSNLEADFKDLTQLAAKIAGTELSLVNLIDSYTQWTIGSYGTDMKQMTREDSVCQYTIISDEPYEVADLSKNELFKDKFYVQDPISLKYYFGVPIKDKLGYNIGALCVLDTQFKELSAEKAEMLKLIATEIVNRLSSYKTIHELQEKLKEADLSKKKVAHDIRGPLAGIIGLSNIINEQGEENKLTEVLDYIKLIHRSSLSLLDLADEILTDDPKGNSLPENLFNLELFKKKLQNLFEAQAKNKGLTLEMLITEKTKENPFPKLKLLQIAGNLISNAIKFTPSGGKVNVSIELTPSDSQKEITIIVSDTGKGIHKDIINQILENVSSSIDGTSGEKGYGFGLQLVRHLVLSLNGKLQINNKPNEKGAIFKVTIPVE